MNLKEIVFVRTVNGHKYHDVDLVDEEGYPVHYFSEVETPNCGLQVAEHICSSPCTKECRCAENLFSEIGFEF